MNRNHYLLPDVAEMCQAMHLAANPVQVGAIGSRVRLYAPGSGYIIDVVQEDNDQPLLAATVTHGNHVLATAKFYEDITGEQIVTFIAATLQQLDAGPQWCSLADLTVRDVELRTLDVVVRHLLGDAWTLEDHRAAKAQFLRALDTIEVAP